MRVWPRSGALDREQHSQWRALIALITTVAATIALLVALVVVTSIELDDIHGIITYNAQTADRQRAEELAGQKELSRVVATVEGLIAQADADVKANGENIAANHAAATALLCTLARDLGDAPTVSRYCTGNSG